MVLQVSIEDAKTQLSELITAAFNGEEVFITQDGQRVVQLVPFVQSKGNRQAGSAKGMIHMSEGFDEPLEDFKEYME